MMRRMCLVRWLLPLLPWRRGTGRGGRLNPDLSIRLGRRFIQENLGASRHLRDLLSPALSSKGGEGKAPACWFVTQTAWQWHNALEIGARTAQALKGRHRPSLPVAVRLLSVLVLLAVWPLHARADLSAGFDAANKLYEQGKFTQAASAYEQLLQSGRASAALYFNLGNARFKAGQIGRAIAAYHQAEQLTPRDPDLRANLQFARNQIQGPTLAPSRWQRALARLSLNEWTLLAAGVVWLWLLLLALRQWRPALKPALRNYVLMTGLAAGLLCACLAAALHQGRYARAAIIITPNAVVRQGPLDESAEAFTVHNGAELRVLDQKDEWLQVSADSRRFGWLRRDQALLTPPR